MFMLLEELSGLEANSEKAEEVLTTLFFVFIAVMFNKSTSGLEKSNLEPPPPPQPRRSGRKVDDEGTKPGLPRRQTTRLQRYLEGPGGMEALAMAGIGLRSKNMGQTPGGLEALRLGGQDPRGRNPNLDSPLPANETPVENKSLHQGFAAVGHQHHERHQHVVRRYPRQLDGGQCTLWNELGAKYWV
ncbi:Inositol-1,4,5-trisphosphate 5-phosphatase 1 [Ciborinia camelliae]|nr:Inositol-1,4,5-trisphosphate 5-phosphatase 1 [Ciborinia camelliae]